MTLAPTLGDALSAALLFLVSLLMMSAVVALVWRLLRPAIEAWAPAARLRITSALLVMPGIAAAVLAIWSAAPHWWSQVLGHCALHRADHSCTWHLPLDGPGSVTWIAVGALGLICFAVAWKLVRLQWHARRLRTTLKLASFDCSLNIHRLPIQPPLALTAGVRRPRIYVSDGLIAALSADELQRVLAHERAHVHRRDGLRRILLAVGSMGHLPHVRRALLQAWELASEQCCDSAVATSPTDRLALADCLLRVARLTRAHQVSGYAVCHFHGGQLEQRIHALVAPRRTPTAGFWFVLLVTALSVTGSVSALAPLLHRLIEQVT